MIKALIETKDGSIAVNVFESDLTDVVITDEEGMETAIELSDYDCRQLGRLLLALHGEKEDA